MRLGTIKNDLGLVKVEKVVWFNLDIKVHSSLGLLVAMHSPFLALQIHLGRSREVWSWFVETQYGRSLFPFRAVSDAFVDPPS